MGSYCRFTSRIALGLVFECIAATQLMGEKYGARRRGYLSFFTIKNNSE